MRDLQKGTYIAVYSFKTILRKLMKSEILSEYSSSAHSYANLVMYQRLLFVSFLVLFLGFHFVIRYVFNGLQCI